LLAEMRFESDTCYIKSKDGCMIQATLNLKMVAWFKQH